MGSKGFIGSYAEWRSAACKNGGEAALRCVGENAVVREEIVRCLWFGGHFRQESLKTDCGRRIEVLSPGWWNVEGGPDFMRAELLLEGEGRVTGDVEVHTHADGWLRHGHHLQPEYNGVVLHVVLWNGGSALSDIFTEDGKRVPQLTLSRYIGEELAELAEILDMDGGEIGPAEKPVSERFCTRAVAQNTITAGWMESFLDAAGDHRLQQKAEKFAAQMSCQPAESVLYRGICESLGFKNNRMPFIQLARRLPLSTLRRLTPVDASVENRGRILESAFLGVGGFLDSVDEEAADSRTERRVTALRDIWNSFPAEVRDIKMSASHWNFAGVRPANYPARRTAALAQLYGRWLHEGLFGRLLIAMRCPCETGRRRPDTALRGAVISLLTGLSDPYWSRHHHFGSPPVQKPVALIGTQRANEILTNVLLPMLLAYARSEGDAELEEKAFLVWSRLPGMPANRILKRMGRMLFPGVSSPEKAVRSFRRQQGLQQLYSDCCLAEEGCRSCVLFRAYRGGENAL